MLFNKTTFLLYLFLILFQTVYSQSDSFKTEKTYYLAFDSIVGIENSVLYNGKRYIDRYRSTKGNHRYYQNFNFTNGNLIYNNQPFFNIPLKYDLQADVLVIKITGDNAFFNLELITEKVSEFWLSNAHFVNISVIDSKEFNGFAELLYSGDQIILYQKAKKTIRERLKNNGVIHEFNEVNTFIFKFKNYVYKIDSKKSLKKIFPSQSNLINAFYAKYKHTQKTNQEKFYKELIESLDQSLKNEVDK